MVVLDVANYLKYLSVTVASMFKFFAGVLAGLALGLTWVETAIFCALGMMLTVSIILFLSELVRKYVPAKKSKKIFSKTKRWAVKIKQRFGVFGIAFLTPILFTPIGGTFLAVAFGYNRQKIWLNMLWCATVWAIVQSLFVYLLPRIKELF